jgi:membrane protease YdiL (CAAX protease family)
MPVFSDVIAAHALRFERPERAPYDAAAGTRLLVAFAMVGLLLHPALGALARAAGLTRERWVWPAIVLLLLVAVALVVHRFVRVSRGAIGLHRWEAWTPRERIYVCTVAPLAAATFGIVFRQHFARLAEAHGWPGVLALSIPTGVLWGMVQEFIYRGLLQTELVRRLGSASGVLFTNVVFTFGPLHFNHYGLGGDGGPHWGMFTAIFAIGLFFGVLYRRSGNLWIPALLHGIWPPNMS